MSKVKSKQISFGEWMYSQLEEMERTEYWLASKIGCGNSSLQTYKPEFDIEGNVIKQGADPSGTRIAKIVTAIANEKRTLPSLLLVQVFDSCYFHKR